MSKNNGKLKKGFLHIGILAVIMLFIVSGVSSCAGGDDEAETTTVKSLTGIEEIEFSDSDPIELYVGETDFDHVNVDYDDEFSEDDIVFVSSDESVVTISLNRKGYSTVYYDVKAVGAGTATIHAETSDGIVKSEELTVTVAEKEPAPIKNIEFSNSVPLELTVGESEYNSIRVDCDDNYGESDIIFVSTDESVAKITWNRKSRSLAFFDIEAVGEGTAVVYAQSADGTVKSEEIMVTVTEDDEEEPTEKATEAKTAVIDETDASNANASTKEYILNTNTMKIHESYCSSVEDISPDNYAETDDYDNAISQGYVPCKRCNP